MKLEDKNKQILLKKARKKYFSYRLAYNLYALNSSLQKSYKNTLYCASILIQQNGQISTTYCKNRWCLLCNSIRTAILINGYMPIIKEFKEPYFVTLTVPTCSEGVLKSRIITLQLIWTKINKLAQRHKISFKGIRKAECTLRPDEQYHYHFHVILEGKAQATWLISRWLEYTKHIGARRLAQDMRAVESLKGGSLELFKYFTKILSKHNGKSYIDYKGLNVIFEALKGHKIFNSFGGIKAISEDLGQIKAQDIENSECIVWEYQRDLWDWLDKNTGEILTGYEPADELKNLLNSLNKS